MNCKLTIARDVLVQDVGDEIVLLDLKSGTYFGLNPVGACVLRSIKDGRDLDEAREQILEEFDVGPEQLDDDMSQLVDELLSRRLLSAQQE